MRVCVLHAPRDLRLEERPALPLGPDQVGVRLGAGGICGSDLHLLRGPGRRLRGARVPDPRPRGRGRRVEVGADVARVHTGDRVAINPSQPCWRCRACQAGRTNLCARMTFYGSAAVLPHVQGAFQDRLDVRREPMPGRARVDPACPA